MNNNRLLCGKIVNTHGVHGEVKLFIYADGPEFFEEQKRLYTKNGEILNILSMRPHKGSLIVKFLEIDTMEKAESIKNCELYLDREDAPPLPGGRYYIVDIIGLRVVTDDGRVLGKITDVITTGSNDVYTVLGEDKKEYLIPVIDEVVLKFDMEKGEVLIHPLKGLFDDEN